MEYQAISLAERERKNDTGEGNLWLRRRESLVKEAETHSRKGKYSKAGKGREDCYSQTAVFPQIFGDVLQWC